MPIDRGHARAGVDEEQNGVAIGERGLGLGAHAARQRRRFALLEAGRVNNGEGKVAEPRFALAAITGHARRVVDQSKLSADQPVEQSRLADIRSTDDRDLAAHGWIPLSGRTAAGHFAAGFPDRTSPSIASAFWRAPAGASGSAAIISSHLPAPSKSPAASAAAPSSSRAVERKAPVGAASPSSAALAFSAWPLSKRRIAALRRAASRKRAPIVESSDRAS